MASSRRALLIGGLALLAGYGALRIGLPMVGGLFPGDLEFEPVADPAGFRRMGGGVSSGASSGAISVGLDPLFGLPEGDGAAPAPDVARVRARLCAALFGAARSAAGIVPMAFFSDYYCPYCRVLSGQIAKIEEASGGELRVIRHELPLLGEASVTAARAVLAAGRQGASAAVHERLMRSPFRPTPAYLSALADDLGLDGARLTADMQSPGVRGQIRDSRALARIFGFIGTPALVVGRTVVQGRIEAPVLRRLIARERADGPVPACART